MKLINVVGARPNFIKIAPIIRAINKHNKYIDFLNLEMYTKFVMTDSGGIQEETTILNIPCLTLRNTTLFFGLGFDRIYAFRILSKIEYCYS